MGSTILLRDTGTQVFSCDHQYHECWSEEWQYRKHHVKNLCSVDRSIKIRDKLSPSQRMLEKKSSWTKGDSYLESRMLSFATRCCWLLSSSSCPRDRPNHSPSEEAQTLKVLALHSPSSYQNILMYPYMALLLTTLCLDFTKKKAGACTSLRSVGTPCQE